MRASDRDREQAVALLRARCVEGYLSVETFEYRLGRALAARTALELRLLVADIARTRRHWRLPLTRSRSSQVVLPAEGTLVVGRSSGCDVVVDEPTVSRRHLQLRALDGAWLAVDLGSMNGTWLLGQRVGRARVLPGDELVLGDCAVALRAPAGA
ncbi:MAG TPA: DUF1707 and FHA domain-containing protein [Solirubrobacteraceae bacterium]